MSFWASAIVAANSAVIAPIQAIVVGTQSYEAAITGLMRVSRNTPPVTIVAAWISADTGVGPSMASGSHRYSGSCALLPAAPINSSIAIAEAVDAASSPVSALSLSTEYDSEPTAENDRNIASMTPQSPTRLVTNAFLPAVAADSRECQKAISRYEHVPTPSQPRNVTSRFSPSTSSVIENTNRFRYKKNFENFGSPCM